MAGEAKSLPLVLGKYSKTLKCNAFEKPGSAIGRDLISITKIIKGPPAGLMGVLELKQLLPDVTFPLFSAFQRKHLLAHSWDRKSFQLSKLV